MDDDNRHLDWLATFHYVLACILALCGLFPVIHLTVGIAILTGALDQGQEPGPPNWFGLIFVIIALFMIASIWAMAIAVWMAGTRLRRRVKYTFCLVVAAIECTFMPFGTVLGVLTILVLMRPTVKDMFGLPTQSLASS